MNASTSLGDGIVEPVELHVVEPAHAAHIVPPPPDLSDSSQARSFLGNEPRNLAHMLAAEEEGGREAAHRAGTHLRRLVAEGVYRSTGRVFALHELTSQGHRQVGLVAGVAVAGVIAGVVRPHEQTRTGREARLSTFVDASGVDVSPVVLACGHQGLVELIDRFASAEPDLQFETFGGVGHRVWIIHDTTELADTARGWTQLTIIDGHHRVAASLRSSTVTHLLAEVVPDGQLRMLGFDRRVQVDDPRRLVQQLAELGRLEPLARRPVRDDADHELLVHVSGSWFALDFDDVGDDPVDRLPPVLVQERVFGPLLGIADPRTDERIEHLAGTGPLDDLEQRFGDDGHALFVPRALRLEEVHAAASAGRMLPPKSTYVDPKPGPGVFMRLRETESAGCS